MVVIHIRSMTTEDLPLGMRLKREAGWNQLESDWRRFLAMEPAGCFVAEVDGAAVATTTTAIFGSAACVALVLVDERLRGRGIGTALMKHALAFLDGRGVRSIRLDATPLGRPVYEKLGFQAEYELARFEGMPRSGQTVEDVRMAHPEELDDIIALDHEVSGIDRRKMLECFFAESPEAMHVVVASGKIQGYLTSRPGAQATQLGPCIGRDDAGQRLLRHAWVRFAGQPAFLDVPLGNKPALAVAADMGLTVQRHLLRMIRGDAIHDRIEDYWAGSGPEKG